MLKNKAYLPGKLTRATGGPGTFRKCIEEHLKIV